MPGSDEEKPRSKIGLYVKAVRRLKSQPLISIRLGVLLLRRRLGSPSLTGAFEY